MTIYLKENSWMHGQHDSTTVCLQALRRVVKQGNSVFDVGTGSGILAIAAKQAKAMQVTATDIDVNAIRLAESNCLLNGVSVELIYTGYLRNVQGQADVIVSNLPTSELLVFSHEVSRNMHDETRWILSGFRLQHESVISVKLQELGFTVINREMLDSYVCYTVVKEG